MDHSDKGVVLTREGYDQFQKELDDILTNKRPVIVDRIREARLLGDLSENFDYQDAKRQLGMLEGRVEELKAILENATVIECSAGDGSVCIGCTVVVKDVDDGFEEEYRIVGSAEAAPSEGKISHESCVGSALLGHKAGEQVTVSSPGGDFTYEIVSVQ